MAIELRPSNIVLPNITVQEKYSNDILISHVITANEGYVMYDTSDETMEPAIDPETGESIIDPETGMFVEVPVTYYYRQATIPVRIPIENWTWIAVLENTIDENNIN